MGNVPPVCLASSPTSVSFVSTRTRSNRGAKWFSITNIHKPPQLAQSSHDDRAAAWCRGPRGSLHSSSSQSDTRHPAGFFRSLPKTHNSSSWGSKWKHDLQIESIALPHVQYHKCCLICTLMGYRLMIQPPPGCISTLTWYGATLIISTKTQMLVVNTHGKILLSSLHITCSDYYESKRPLRG